MTAGTAAAELLAGSRAPWAQLSAHPFVAQAGDGSLRRATFDRWLIADHFFAVGFRRFLTGLVTLAPDEHAADTIAAGLGALQTELDLFRREAATRGLDLDVEPGPTVIGYTAFLRASLQDGYPVALTVLYGAEKAYFDAWSAVRATASRESDYWRFVDNWSSPAFARLGGLDRRAAGRGGAGRADHRDAGVVRPRGPLRAAVLERRPRRRHLVTGGRTGPATRAGYSGRRSGSPGSHGVSRLATPGRPDRDHGGKPRSRFFAGMRETRRAAGVEQLTAQVPTRSVTGMDARVSTCDLKSPLFTMHFSRSLIE